MKPSIEAHIVDRTEELIAYINDPGRVPDRQKPDELENTFVKLVIDHLEGRLDTTLDKVGLTTTNPKRLQLFQAVTASMANTNINRDTLLASPTVSIHRQQSLYERLEKSLKKNGPGYIIPKHPLDSNAYRSYLAAMKRCHDEVMKYPKTDKTHKYFALIAVRWMKGEPLPQIIDASFNYKSLLKSTSKPPESELRCRF